MFSERLTKLVPYTPGEQPYDKRYIKLNTNENPYSPSPAVKKALERYDLDTLRLYPDPLASGLREKLARAYGVRKENVFAGNGSDEVLSFCFYAFFDSREGPLLFPEHTYSFYPVYCAYYGIEYRTIPLNHDFSIDVGTYKENNPSCGIVIPNPNAPTGIYLEVSEIERLLRSSDPRRVVLIDEAYIDFGGESAIGFLGRFKNLLVVRTFSKCFSLAGLRIGFAIGDESLIGALFTVKDSFNSYPLGGLAQKLGEAAVSDLGYYSDINIKVAQTRDAIASMLQGLGWHVLPSRANFIFAGKPGTSGKQVYTRLKEKGILVRYFDKEGIREYVRITIGTPGQMDSFIDAVKKLF
jgi:histidinol-phosphate aminotransferase